MQDEQRPESDDDNEEILLNAIQNNSQSSLRHKLHGTPSLPLRSLPPRESPRQTQSMYEEPLSRRASNTNANTDQLSPRLMQGEQYRNEQDLPERRSYHSLPGRGYHAAPQGTPANMETNDEAIEKG